MWSQRRFDNRCLWQWTGNLMFRIDSEAWASGIWAWQKTIEWTPNRTLNGVDILFVPVGWHVLWRRSRAKVANAWAKIVIPMAFKSDNDPKQNQLRTSWKKWAQSATGEKLIIKKTLPEEGTQVMVVEKSDNNHEASFNWLQILHQCLSHVKLMVVKNITLITNWMIEVKIKSKYVCHKRKKSKNK